MSLFVALLLAQGHAGVLAGEAAAHARFEQLRHQPVELRRFLQDFPKGGDLHNHLDGAVYAESYIRWAAEDGKCIELESLTVRMPPCNAQAGRPALSELRANDVLVNRIIDAFSVRNYERGSRPGHEAFFSTFARFFPASIGREGDMLAEVSARAARQNILYLELMQSWGMAEAQQLAKTHQEFDRDTPLAQLVGHPEITKLAAATRQRLDDIEAAQRAQLDCAETFADAGCTVTIRYLAQVIRTFPPAQALAQTLLAFRLIDTDPRYVGLNFVAPEDHPVATRDYRYHMTLLGALAEYYPEASKGIALHAGELTLGLVPPEQLGWRIRMALETAGARRIGHGVDIIYDPQASQLMRAMARQGILVEINLTSNDVILGVRGKRHPFMTYREHGVPVALSTDDEGVVRIDLSHEYQRAVQTYNLSYADIKQLSRNALAYSFLPGNSLLLSTADGRVVQECDYDSVAPAILCPDSRTEGAVGQCPQAEEALEQTAQSCLAFMFRNEKARLQFELERRFDEFEAGYAPQDSE